MVWETITSMISSNLGMNLETALFIIYLLIGIVWYAVDFKIGVMMSILIALGFFVWLFSVDMQYFRFLVVMILGIVLLCFSLYANATAKQGSGLI